MNRIITAVSLNPAIDRTVQVPGFAAGVTNRVQTSRTDPGGKGINVARVVKALGGEVRVIGFMGQENGDLHTRHLAAIGIPAHFIPVPGETRVNIKVVDPQTGRLTEINDSGFSVTPHHLDALRQRVSEALATSAVLVLGGSLPAGAPATIYRDLIEAANAAGVPTILDADGEPLARGLSARPTLIKPNQAEAEALLGRALASREDVAAAAQELLRLGPLMAVISQGAAGAVLAAGDGCWWAGSPSIKPGSTVGAGDSMVAGLALAIARGLPHAEALRLATAAGAGTARLEGTQVCSTDDVASLLDLVTVEPFQALHGGRS